ncbi:unnamed protein product, partial [Allacma fusca]
GKIVGVRIYRVGLVCSVLRL